MRRRRAVGGPAERALGSLVGLELRPRRMREAAAMWRAVTDAVGVAARDALWDYPDLMPTADDIDDPAALVARLEARARGEEPAPDEMDDALARLLAGEKPSESGDGPDGRRRRRPDGRRTTTAPVLRIATRRRLLPRRADRRAAAPRLLWKPACACWSGRHNRGMLRLDPAHPPLWRSATTLQFGADPVAIVHDPAPWQQRLVHELARGIPDDALEPVAAAFGAPDAGGRRVRAPHPPGARATRCARAAARLTVQVPAGLPGRATPTPWRDALAASGFEVDLAPWYDAPDEADPGMRRPSSLLAEHVVHPRRAAAAHGERHPAPARSCSPAAASRSVPTCGPGAPPASRASPPTAATPTRRGRSSPHS